MIRFDRDLLQAFEDQLKPWDPESGRIPAKILGYGEISAVLQIPGMDHLAFKRLPPFESPAQRQAYRAAVEAYCDLLQNKHHVEVVDYRCVELDNRAGEPILYIAQPLLPAQAIGNQFLRSCSDQQFNELLTEILQRLLRIWQANERNGPAELVGLDAQVSNWAYWPASEKHATRLQYFDISTPFIRRHGRETLQPEIFLKSVPSFLVWLVRWAFLQQVLDRYYDLRLVLIDFVANFHKEKLQHRIDAAVAGINAFLQGPAAALKIAPLQRKEIDKYYREDAFIWTIFLNFRRLDRFLKTRLLRQT
ncbi:MAG: hypothetical protein D6814_08875 [Calditrichaeota bacterium]|nr:MAG: hypothetical protein D6814_08875 [Calditrichota bacterium]